MEGSTVAVFRVRKINKVSFGNRRKRINNNLIAPAPLSLSLTCSLYHSIILTLVLVPPFFSKFDIAGCASQQVWGTAGSASSKVVGDSF